MPLVYQPPAGVASAAEAEAEVEVEVAEPPGGGGKLVWRFPVRGTPGSAVSAVLAISAVSAAAAVSAAKSAPSSRLDSGQEEAEVSAVPSALEKVAAPTVFKLKCRAQEHLEEVIEVVLTGEWLLV